MSTAQARPTQARTSQARTAQAPRPAPARTGPLRRLLACAGRAVRATHAARVPF